MIIGYFHIIGIAISEAKAYTPLALLRDKREFQDTVSFALAA
jgi:hypothetical protein